MSKFIKKDENGFYVFHDIEFLKTLPTGLEYFAVDRKTEKMYNLGFNYKENMKKQLVDLETQLSLTEKALELACKELHVELENPDNELYTKTSDEYVEYFKTKAKEMMKSE